MHVDFERIRKEAEKIARQQSARKEENLTPDEVQELLTELETRRIELEMIREELYKSMAAREVYPEQEWKYRTMADMGMALIWTSGIDTKCNYFNQVWLNFTGRTLEQELGNGWAEGVHPEDLTRCVETYLGSFEKKMPFSMVYRLRHHTGDYHWILDEGTPMYDPEGNFSGYIGHCLDVDDHIGSQEEVRKLSVAIEQSPILTIITNREGIIEFVNPKVVEFTGYSRSELIGQNPRIFNSGAQSGNTYADMYRKLHAGQTWKGEFFNRKKDGTFYWVSASISPVIDSAGETSHYLAIEEDITDRKEAERIIREFNSSLEQKIAERTRALSETNTLLENEMESRNQLEKRLEEEKKRLSYILEGTGAGTWEWNIQTGETIFNERWAEIVGYTLAELAPVSILTWESLCHTDDLPKSAALLEEHFMGTTEIYSFESRMRHKNGTWVWVLDRGKVHKWDENGQPLLMSGIHLDITQQKIVEEKLHWNQSLLNLMSESSPLGFLVVDNRTDNILYANSHFCKIWNITHLEEQIRKGELKNNDIIPHCLPVLADVPAFAESCKPLQSEDNRQVVEDQIAFKENRTIRRFSTQIRGADDEYYGRFYIFEEITDQVNSKNLIEQTRRNYETFFNTIDDFLWVLDQEGKIIHMNNTVVKRLEYTEDELYHKSVLMVHPPERREEAGRIVGDMLNGIKEFCPVPVVTSSGRQIPVETRIKQGFWNGEPVLFGVSKDVSKIVLSEEKFSKAFQSNGALMAISTFETGVFIDVNQTFLDTLGFRREEVIGVSSAQLNLFPDLTVRETTIEKMKQKIQVRGVEMMVYRKDRSAMIGLLSADFIYIGEELCILTMLIDISERKRAEDELWVARQDAEKANMAKSEFLSRMSHELRTPMNSILGFSQLLEMSTLDNSQKKAVGHISSSGKHLLHLINEVLDLSRIEAGKIKLSIETVDVFSLIRETVDSIRPIAARKNITINQTGVNDCPLFVSADMQKLSQVLLNLLSNAVKYNYEGGSVSIFASKAGNDRNNKSSARISISDTGFGISESNLDRLFIPFERIGAESTLIEGTGLGLAVSRQLTELMGGTMGVESKLGQGSTFWIELPLDERSSSDGNLDAETILKPELTGMGIIFYIEDNQPNIELIQTFLENYFPEIHFISSTIGRNALDIAKISHPDLILLDLNLPDISGKAVLQNLKADPATRNIPVVIVSADALPTQIKAMESSGMVCYLTKPVDLGELSLIIRKYIK